MPTSNPGLSLSHSTSPLPRNQNLQDKSVEGEETRTRSRLERSNGRYWRWDSSTSKMVFTRVSRSDETVTRDMKTTADTQITFQVPEIPEEQPIEQQDFHLEMPPTPYLQYTPLFPASNSTSLSDMPTPDGTFSDSYSFFPTSSSNSIYHSNSSSITGPLTPTGIGLRLSGLTRKDGTPLDSFGLAGFSSSPWRASPQAESESIPSQKFLNEILYTFTQERDTSRDPVRRKVALTRNLSAPTVSSSCKQLQRSRSRSDSGSSLPIWR
ncbi:hypothetical protein PM082_006568 [Marasmius tenuissimus]|nr:hypothetical protein PM082_006568 [Marasmius tenuissimus]